jgi:hypothetical protein
VITKSVQILLLGDYVWEDRVTPTNSMTVECMVAWKYKEKVDKETVLIAQQD